jgi:adenylate cyclase
MKKFIRLFSTVNPFTLALCTTMLVVILFRVGIPFLEIMELKTYDLRFRSRGTVEPSPHVVLAVIDEKSLDKLGRWPWPRARIAALVDALSRDGAKAVGFDIVFSEPDKNSSLEFISQLDGRIQSLNIKNKKLEKFIIQSKKKADNDLALADAFKDSTASVVLGYFFHMSGDDLDDPIDGVEIDRRLRLIKTSKYGLVMYDDERTERSPFTEAYAPEVNLKAFAESTDASGYFNMMADNDGVIRWMPLILECGEYIFPPLSIQCAWHFLGRPQMVVKVADIGVEGIRMGDRFLPTDEEGRLLINYLGPERTFPYYSISDIIDGRLAKGTFRDKIVLVGATAVAVYDVRNTPFSTRSSYPGMEVHASVIDNILKQNFLSKPEWTKIFDLLAIIAMGVLLAVVLPRVNAVKGIVFAAGLFVLHIFICRWLFVGPGVVLNIVYPLLTLLVTYTSLTVYHYVTEERERKKIKGAFSYYVSTSVVNEMLKHPDRLKLGGDKRDLSVLFSDIRGFTTISEKLSPEELVHLLNEYLTVMTDVVFKYDGTLDKYMGDAVMAIYGAPLDQHDHPSRACHSALDMMKALKKLNEKWIVEGKSPMDIGIGINTGMMMVGNMGSDQRFDYTVMGDEVNLGSRLEGANKNYRTNILLSEFTYDRVKDEFVCMEVDSVRVKGKTHPVRIYQLHGHKGISETRDRAIFQFQRGLELYKQQRWDEALNIFQKIPELDEGLSAAEIYVQRCLELKSNPPPPDWDGVFTMTTK